jgi:hypothetical protein
LTGKRRQPAAIFLAAVQCLFHQCLSNPIRRLMDRRAGGIDGGTQSFARGEITPNCLTKPRI